MQQLPLAVRRLETALEGVGDGLVGEREWSAARQVLQGVPDLFEWALLELRTTDDPQTDFMVSVSDSFPGRTPWRGLERKHPMMAPAHNLIECWTSNTGPWAACKELWLEFDMPGCEPQTPMVSASISPGHLGGKVADAELTHEVSLLEAALRALTPSGSSSESQLHGVLTLRESLSPADFLVHIATLHARGRNVVRLTLSVARISLIPWLKSIGWPGSFSGLEETLGLIGRSWARFGVQVEVGDDGLTPYLALETMADGYRCLAIPPLLQRFEERSLGVPEKLRRIADATNRLQALSPAAAKDHYLYLKHVIGEHPTAPKLYFGARTSSPN